MQSSVSRRPLLEDKTDTMDIYDLFLFILKVGLKRRPHFGKWHGVEGHENLRRREISQINVNPELLKIHDMLHELLT